MKLKQLARRLGVETTNIEFDLSEACERCKKLGGAITQTCVACNPQVKVTITKQS